jgi:hypothetical protein
MQKVPVKYPYGISNFEKLAEQDFVFVDKTKYIEKLEMDENYSIFLRPRRMGKSLFISILEYYYDILEKDKFEKLFPNIISVSTKPQWLAVIGSCVLISAG